MQSWHSAYIPNEEAVRFICREHPDKYFIMDYDDPDFFALNDSTEKPDYGVMIARQGWQRHWTDESLRKAYQTAIIPPGKKVPCQSSVLWVPETGYNITLGYMVFRHTFIMRDAGSHMDHVKVPESLIGQLITVMKSHGLVMPALPKPVLGPLADRSDNLQELLQRRSP